MDVLFAKTKSTNAANLGITHPTHTEISAYAFFHFTFLGYNFLCAENQIIKRKSQVFLTDPIEAYNMATSLMIPSHYTLVTYSRTLSHKQVA